MFAAKRADAAAARSRTPILLAGGAIVLLVVGGAAYLWYALGSLTTPPAPARTALAPRPVVPAAPPPAPAPAATPQAMPPAAAVPGLTAPGPRPTYPALAVVKPEALSPESRRAPPPPRAAERLVMDLLRERTAASVNPPLKLARSIEAPRVSPDLAAGYEALRANDLPAARRRYEAAIAADPASADALLGLATVEARSGQREAASRHYRRVLVIDPRNATAIAGLAALADFSRPAAVEASLRSDLARYPESAPLHFALGSLYASQARWGEAQTAFFEAHRLDPGNADVMHNLAVSLDHLAQPRLAADFYRRALARSGSQAVQFDTRAAERRLAELGR